MKKLLMTGQLFGSDEKPGPLFMVHVTASMGKKTFTLTIISQLCATVISEEEITLERLGEVLDTYSDY